ncbi:MAG: 2-oxoacid ferredoxin oxidoreductase [Nitrospirae bacterium GWC2_57_13]|jgi:2-oxoglutarate/2-oxoacid ferredoxin oxidoreductase subunit beta|nr:MAG: 2-oxoacid ferredoxin oxidoreductase [Nitrospirae bacterium GWC2_57_13]OGW46655.1 MAG: 2-oxoacid ferredoxin oxidoreductase [Nitrospirae bacterium GWD2_57_8]HAS53514.1 2-oxoacid ferredoxin oxidoreductase [Nitrospiraceae bacterium]
MVTAKDYEGQVPTWCPGCGNFSILTTFREAMAELEIEPHQFTMVSGIGQASKFPHYIRCNTFNGLHGRTLPVATGLRLANHEMLVIAVAGDGDCYGEGGNHLAHTMRRNVNVKLFVHDNQIYGLTKGQASPTTGEGTKTKNMPAGVISEQLNPMALAVALDCSFAARGFAGDGEHLKGLIKEAVKHKGFTLVDILQPCVTFNKVNTYEWYSKRVYRLGPEHDPADRSAAFTKALEWGERIPLGVIYRRQRPIYEEQVPVLAKAPLVRLPAKAPDIGPAIREFF